MIPKYNKILFATDLSRSAHRVFEHALGIAAVSDASIVILHVIDESSPTAGNLLRNFLGEEKWKELKEKQEQQSAQALLAKKRDAPLIRESLRRFYGEIGGDRHEGAPKRDEVVISWGLAADEIMVEAREKGCDLIVMGHTPRGPLSEAVMGSITRAVVKRSRIPVLVVPVSDKDGE